MLASCCDQGFQRIDAPGIAIRYWSYLYDSQLPMIMYDYRLVTLVITSMSILHIEFVPRVWVCATVPLHDCTEPAGKLPAIQKNNVMFPQQHKRPQNPHWKNTGIEDASNASVSNIIVTNTHSSQDSTIKNGNCVGWQWFVKAVLIPSELLFLQRKLCVNVAAPYMFTSGSG